jgi:hypothetical protein
MAKINYQKPRLAQTASSLGYLIYSEGDLSTLLRNIIIAIVKGDYSELREFP